MIFLLRVVITLCLSKYIITSSFDSKIHNKNYDAEAMSQIRTAAFLSFEPTAEPSQPTTSPTFLPTAPTPSPSIKPTAPTVQPTIKPSRPTANPTYKPSSPTLNPTLKPTHPTRMPTGKPTKPPSPRPTKQPVTPTWMPSCQPTSMPTTEPTSQPSSYPSSQPTTEPSNTPTSQPSAQPSFVPSVTSMNPSLSTHGYSSCLPSIRPSFSTSSATTIIPSECPTVSSSAPRSSPTVSCTNSNIYSNYFTVLQMFSNLTQATNISSTSGIFVLTNTVQSILPCVSVRFLGVTTAGTSRLRKLSLTTILAYNVLFSSQGSSVNAEYSALSMYLISSITSGLFTSRYRQLATTYVDLELAAVASNDVPIITPSILITQSPSQSPVSTTPAETTTVIPVGIIAGIAAGGSVFIITVVTMIFFALRKVAEKEQRYIENKQEEEKQDSGDDIDSLDVPLPSNKSNLFIPAVEESKHDTPQLSPATSTEPSFSPDKLRLTRNFDLSESLVQSPLPSPNPIQNKATLLNNDETFQILIGGIDPLPVAAKSEIMTTLPLPPIRRSSAPPMQQSLTAEEVTIPPIPISTLKPKSGASLSSSNINTSNITGRRGVRNANPILRRYSLTSSLALSSSLRSPEQQLRSELQSELQSEFQPKQQQPPSRVKNLHTQPQSGVAIEPLKTEKNGENSKKPSQSSTLVSARVEEFESLAKTQRNKFYSSSGSSQSSCEGLDSSAPEKELEHIGAVRIMQDEEHAVVNNIMSSTPRVSGKPESEIENGSRFTRTAEDMNLNESENQVDYSKHYPLNTSAFSPTTSWSDSVQDTESERVYDVDKSDEYNHAENSVGTGIDWFG